MEAGIVTLPERKFEELLTLADIPTTQCRMGQKDLERLVGKICSMHLAVPGVVAHLFHIQRALNQGELDRLWLSPAFYRELTDWKALALQAASRPTHLAEIVRREPTHLKFCDASGNCNVPPPGWFYQPQETSRLPSAPRARQAPHTETQDLRTQGPPFLSRKGHPPGNCSLHRCRRSHLFQLHIPPHLQPFHHWLLLLYPVLQLHKVHRPPPDSPIPAPHGLGVLRRELSPTRGRPHQAFPLCHKNCHHPRQSEE